MRITLFHSYIRQGSNCLCITKGENMRTQCGEKECAKKEKNERTNEQTNKRTKKKTSIYTPERIWGGSGGGTKKIYMKTKAKKRQF